MDGIFHFQLAIRLLGLTAPTLILRKPAPGKAFRFVEQRTTSPLFRFRYGVTQMTPDACASVSVSDSLPLLFGGVHPGDGIMDPFHPWVTLGTWPEHLDAQQGVNFTFWVLYGY